MTEIPLPEVEEIHEPVNQWHAQLMRQANATPVSQKIWPTAPVKKAYERKEKASFDWPENAI